MGSIYQPPNAVWAVSYRYKRGSTSGGETELVTSHQQADAAITALWREHIDKGTEIKDVSCWRLTLIDGEFPRLAWIPYEIRWPDAGGLGSAVAIEEGDDDA